MKLIKIVQAYKILETLSDIKDYHVKEQWALYSLRKELHAHDEFYKEKMEAINDKYREHTDNNGILTGQYYQEYTKEVEELNNLDIDLNTEIVCLPFVDGITFKIAEPLEGFVEFTMD